MDLERLPRWSFHVTTVANLKKYYSIFLVLILLFLIGCGEWGCIDENACNYDSDAVLADSTSCIYSLDDYDCDDNCLLDLDCNDECGGLDFTCVDECGVFYGDDSIDDGFCQDDLDFLIDLADTLESINQYEYEPLQIGYQYWTGSRLTTFNLNGGAYDCIAYIPESIGNLTSLTSLNFGSCNIQNLPEELFNLLLLSYLNLANNQIISIPSNMENLTNLENLYLNDNDITTLPDEIGNLFNLGVLHLGNNQLTSLPESIGNLSDLNSLYLNSNELTELPESFCDLNATYINLQYNNLCDEYDYNYCINIIFGYEDQSNCCDGENGISNWTQCDD